MDKLYPNYKSFIYKCLMVTAGDLEDLKSLFLAIDTDKDGKINVEDLMTARHIVGETAFHQELYSIITELQESNGSYIDFKRSLILHIRKTMSSVSEDDDIRNAFKCLDMDGDGFITPSELQKANNFLGCPITVEEAQTIIKDADLDGDGKICIEEFWVAVKNGV